MAPQSDPHELLDAWRALASATATDGWHTIRIAAQAPCGLRAGRKFPGNQEALLVGLSVARMPPTRMLPQGVGFLVSRADLRGDEDGRVWIALSRQAAGSLDFFTMMSTDIVETLIRLQSTTEERLFDVFLGRIRAWQDFMRGRSDLLTPDAEVGLFGELEILRDILAAGIPSSMAVESWKGPLDGIQDYALGTGAIEVKSTAAPAGFTANVGSLEQLDDSLTRPLFLAAIRLTLADEGRTLPEEITEVCTLLNADPAATEAFRTRLLHAGFVESASERYTRCFRRVETFVLPVAAGFPRLTRASMPIEVLRASYDLHLDLPNLETIDLKTALRKLGVI